MKFVIILGKLTGISKKRLTVGERFPDTRGGSPTAVAVKSLSP